MPYVETTYIAYPEEYLKHLPDKLPRQLIDGTYWYARHKFVNRNSGVVFRVGRIDYLDGRFERTGASCEVAETSFELIVAALQLGSNI
jgi:hypothetical protein